MLDCGLFHTFDGDERPGYVASLASVTAVSGSVGRDEARPDRAPDCSPTLSKGL